MSEEDFAKKLIAEYSDKPKNKIDDLVKLDKQVKKPAYIFAFTFGIIGTLILGIGMCLAMEVIGGTTPLIILGIIVGIIGIAMVSTNYPFFVKILNIRKKKFSQEVISLSNEILNNK